MIESSPTHFPHLVADIGGSNARFGWLQAAGEPVRHIRKFAVADFATPVLAANTYLHDIKDQLGTTYRAPRRAAFAVAATLDGDQVSFTNAAWRFSREQTRIDLELESLLVLNDFEALAVSLPYLAPSQLRAHVGMMPAPTGTLAVIGPGTGLGVAGLVETRHGWVVLPGEGGHVTLSAADDFESAVLMSVRKEFPHVSAERLLSGIGLPLLHRAIVVVIGADADSLTTETIVARGLDESDANCEKTIDVFCALLGSFAGNVALTLGARGGVYIGGGMVPRLGERFFASRFRERFESKGRFREYLASIPTALITDTSTALSGAAIAINRKAG